MQKQTALRWIRNPPSLLYNCPERKLATQTASIALSPINIRALSTSLTNCEWENCHAKLHQLLTSLSSLLQVTAVCHGDILTFVVTSYSCMSRWHPYLHCYKLQLYVMVTSLPSLLQITVVCHGNILTFVVTSYSCMSWWHPYLRYFCWYGKIKLRKKLSNFFIVNLCFYCFRFYYLISFPLLSVSRR